MRDCTCRTHPEHLVSASNYQRGVDGIVGIMLASCVVFVFFVFMGLDTCGTESDSPVTPNGPKPDCYWRRTIHSIKLTLSCLYAIHLYEQPLIQLLAARLAGEIRGFLDMVRYGKLLWACAVQSHDLAA
jgi:hypothetical protein